MNKTWAVGTIVLIAVLAACAPGGSPPASTAVSAPLASGSPTSESPPAGVGAAFCDLLDARAGILAGAVAETYHAAQQGDFDRAVAVSRSVVLPALERTRRSLDTIGTWQPAVAFAAHAEPLVDEFKAAAGAFVDDPKQETFNLADAAGQKLRDELFSKEFARVGPDLFRAKCA